MAINSEVILKKIDYTKYVNMDLDIFKNKTNYEISMMLGDVARMEVVAFYLYDKIEELIKGQNGKA
jgi:hypothetical protein